MPKIQLRHDTSTNWTTYNPVLLAGEAGVETDTNKFKIGDGSTAWNSLPYQGGDFSNYYTKSQTDELLNAKQDKLSPNPPLTITEYTKNNLEGFVYTSDNTGLLTAGVSDSSKAYLTRWESGNTSTFAIECYANGYFADSQDKNNLWSSGYIDIPYTFGQVVGGGKSSYSIGWSDCNIIFGKFVNDEFIPITFPLYIGSSGCRIQVSNSDTFNYSLGTQYCSMYQTDVPVYGGSSYGTQTSISTALESERAYGSLCQLVDTGSTIKVNIGYGETFASYNGGSLTSSSYSRLKEITTARIIGVYDKGGQSSHPLIIDGIGLYNSENEITATTFVTTDVLGENLFDIGGETKQTYLDLHIGSGLSVSNGNLVNTNPTAPTVMTGATSSTAGTSGLVPQPVAGDDTKFLSGDGTWATVDTSNLANKDLSNLSTTGESKLHALKGYSDEGELLTDAEGLADVKSYAHSTFDSTKFTKVGSPTITDDGIASGFSSSNYITVNNPGINFNNSLIFQIKRSPNANGQLINGRTTINTCYFWLVNNTTLRAIWRNSSGADVLNHDFTVNSNTEIFTFVITKNSISVYENNVLNSTYNVDTSTFNLNISNWEIGIAGQNNAYTGSIDLKQFSITVDGVEVFNGNKTGIDTIKPDNYTVEGTPTISADGVASNISASNYITFAKNITFSNDVEIYFNGSTDTLLGPTVGENPLLTLLNDNNIEIALFEIRASGSNQDVPNSFIALKDADGASIFANYIGANLIWEENVLYYFRFKFDGEKYTVARKTINTDYEVFYTINSTTQLGTVSKGYIGRRHANKTYNKGLIDLNGIKVYSNGSLVYQPCLKIPYTKAINGEKVVSSVYRPRVNDMRQQFGFACYRTLSDTDYTLPQTSVYQNNQRFLLDSSRDGISYWELYSDRTLEQGGTCVSGVEYNLVKRFADDNYVLTIPYSSKTATSFIPSATGDFIAKGQGLL